MIRISRTAIMLLCLGLAVSILTAAEIHQAAQVGDLVKVRTLIEKEPGLINAKDESGRTPLHWAARGVHFEALQYLVERGADVNAQDANGTMALHSAAARGHLEACQWLIDKGARVDSKNSDGATPFYYAALAGRREVLDCLLANGANKADLEMRDTWGRTPLCAVSRDGGDAQTLKTLLDLGADVNAADSSGWTPIMLAAWRPYPDAVNVLLDAGAACGSPRRDDFPVLSGPYLGQTPPGNRPVLFAPGIVSTGLYTRDIAISKAGDEIFFCVADGGFTAIFATRLAGGRWSEPAIAPFSGRGFLDFEPHLSPDGRQLLFLSNRPPEGREPGNGWLYQHIWTTTRTEKGWGEPQLVAAPINTEDNEFFPSVTKDNVLYFTRAKKNGSARIYKAKLENGRYAEPEMLPFTVPEKGMLFNAFVSPQEDFLITCALNIDAANVDQDYYVSFRMPGGGWNPLIRFGPEINTPGDNANSAFVSPDGRYLFFSSSRRDPSKPEIKSGTKLRDIIRSKSEPGSGSSAIYWVSSKIIEDIKPKELK